MFTRRNLIVGSGAALACGGLMPAAGFAASSVPLPKDFARARPDHTTVLVIGDGGFMMTISELETAVREDLPLVIVVMNDCAYGAELHVLRPRQLPTEKSLFPDIDFADVAACFAFETATIRSLDDLAAVAPLLANPQGPVLLDCKINQDVVAPFMGELVDAVHSD